LIKTSLSVIVSEKYTPDIIAVPPIDPALGIIDMSFGGSCWNSGEVVSEHPHNKLQQTRIDKINI